MKKRNKGGYRNLKSKLKIGKTYELIFLKESGEEKERRKLKLVGIYPYIAAFKDKSGFLECYRYWDLERLLKGLPN